MAAYLDVDAIQHWLESTKLTLTNVDTGIDEYARSVVFGRLAASYDTSSWTTKDNSPSIVVQLVSMLAAAAEYRKAYSEDLIDGQGLNWAAWLETTAAGMMTDINSGTLLIPALEAGDAGLREPTFLPNDSTSVDDPAKFTMSVIF